MPLSEFEEKEYEAPLYNQLERASNLLWAPGQVLEDLLAFDRAMFIDDLLFWQVIGAFLPKKGRQLSRYLIHPFFDRLIRPAHRELPNFKLNLFIQAKRPNYSNRSAKILKQYGFTGKHWSIDIKKEQQETLFELSKILGEQCYICYAGPAFDRKKDLFKFTKNNSIVKNSNFPPVVKLVNHSKWHYNSSGTSGVANEELEIVNFENLEVIISKMSNEYVSYDNKLEDINTLYSAISKVIFNPELKDTEINFKVINSFNELERFGEIIKLNDKYLKYLQIVSFVNEFELQWYVIGAKRSNVG